jgi:hypothetical protein
MESTMAVHKIDVESSSTRVASTLAAAREDVPVEEIVQPIKELINNMTNVFFIFV